MASTAYNVGNAAADGSRKFFTRCVTSVSPSLFYLLGLVGAVVVALFTGILVLFLIHQLTIWVSQDPVRAFHGSQVALSAFASGWDVGAAAYNGVRELVIILLPVWNGLSMYAVQPAIFVLIEVMVLTFSDKAYNGVLDEDTLPFEGHRCVAEGEEITAQNEATAQFCGNALLYSRAIGTTRGANEITGNATLVMSVETARRLSEVSADTILAQIGLAPLLDGLQALASAVLTITATVSDIFWHLAYEVLSIALKLLFQVFMLLVRSLGAAFMNLMSGGTALELLGIGISFFMIFVTEWLIPMFMRTIDMVFCVVDLLLPDGWAEQLDCIEKSCYPEGAMSGASWFPFAVLDPYNTFTSVPYFWNKITTIVEKVTNKMTGQSYDTTSGGKTEMPSFGGEAFPTSPKTEQCMACFQCKVCIAIRALIQSHSLSRNASRARRCRSCVPSGSSSRTRPAASSTGRCSKAWPPIAAWQADRTMPSSADRGRPLASSASRSRRRSPSLRPPTPSIARWMAGAPSRWSTACSRAWGATPSRALDARASQ